MIAGDADFVLGALVEGGEVSVANRPVSEGAAVGHAVTRGHAEIVGVKAPRLHAPHTRTAADGEGVELIACVVGEHGVWVARCVDKDPRMPGGVGCGVVAVERQAMVAEVVAGNLGVGEGATAFEEQHAAPALGEHPG